MTPEAFINWATGAATATAIATIIASVIAMITGISAAFLTTRASIKNSERNILIENITQERAKWREKIRTMAIDVYKAAIKKDSVWLAELKLTFACRRPKVDHRRSIRTG